MDLFLRRAAGAFCLVLAAILVLAHPSSASAAEQLYADDIATRLNPTGRTVSFPVPLKDNGTHAGDITIQITPDDDVPVEKPGLLTAIGNLALPDVTAALNRMPDASGFLRVHDVQAAGLALRFDPGIQELVIDLRPEQRPEGEINLGGRKTRVVSGALRTPEAVSGYLNVVAGLDQLWDTGVARGSLYEDQPSARLELDSAVRIGGAVIENRAAYEGDVDTSICPVNATCTYGHLAGLKRQTSRVIYDLPASELRLTFGDTDGTGVAIQRPTDVLGVSIEKSPAKLNPGQSIAATGAGSFRIDRNANVEVIVNGASVQHLQLRPGTYNLRDLPLTTGANDVSLAITDEAGERQVIAFKAYSDPRLLAAGKSEWSMQAGLPSYLLDNERTYAMGDYMGSGFFRYGLSDAVTALADLQADEDVQLAGAGANLGTEWGAFGLHVAVSSSRGGSGIAADFDWSLVNFGWLTSEREESLNVSAEYRSTDFRTPGEFLTDASGILYPEFSYWLRLNASYSLPLPGDVSATVSGRYQFDDPDRSDGTGRLIAGDRYGADVTLSRPIGSNASASLLLGYSNEIYSRNLFDATAPDPEFRVALRVNVRPADSTYVAASYDTLGNQATVSGYQSEGNGVGRWDTSIEAQHRGYQDTASVSASAGYRSNRAELRLAHYGDADRFQFDAPLDATTRQRTSLRVGTAIAFAGDKVAVGAPVRGGAFAIVAPHDSLGGRTVNVGTADHVVAAADGFGNALLPDLPAYSPSTTSVDVEDLPLGYSLGSGVFETYAPYKAGYVFEVGSGHSVTVYGTLLKSDGTPVALQTGTATAAGDENRSVAVFTNGEGRFGAEGLAPGRWTITMAGDEGVMRYAVVVPQDAMGLVKVGTLQPIEGYAP